jgi:hypothetical protein
MKTTVVLVWVLLIAGCASHRTRIHCEAHLKPINALAAVTKAGGEP